MTAQLASPPVSTSAAPPARSAAPEPLSRASWILLVLLAAAAAGARWLTRSPGIYNWDSVHYLLAQDRYDILAHQPHPPGSWYYVLLARAAREVTGDPHTALLLLSALSGGTLVLVLFLLARDLADERAGWLAASIGASAPLFWFYGSVGLNYAPAGTLSALVALGCVRLCLGHLPAASALLAGASLGLLGGFRPTDALFLAPAFLWALGCAQKAEGKGKREEGRGQRGSSLPHALCPQPSAPALAVTAVLTLGWLLPNVASAGGIQSYVQSIREQDVLLGDSSAFTAGWPALAEALTTHRRSLESTLGAGWIVAVLALWAAATRRLRRSPSPPLALAPFLPIPRAVTLSGPLIVLPAFSFYLLGHFNSPGYTFTYAGFLVAAAAALCSRVTPTHLHPQSGYPTHTPTLFAALLAANTGLFLLGWPAEGGMGQRSLSHAEIRDHSRYYRELGAFLRARHRPGEARILASWSSTDGLRVVQALLPEYAADVAQAVEVVSGLPMALRSSGWLRLMTPAQIRAEGRPVYAIVRAKEDSRYHCSRALFGHRWEAFPIGTGHVVYQLQPTASHETNSLLVRPSTFSLCATSPQQGDRLGGRWGCPRLHSP